MNWFSPLEGDIVLCWRLSPIIFFSFSVSCLSACRIALDSTDFCFRNSSSESSACGHHIHDNVNCLYHKSMTSTIKKWLLLMLESNMHWAWVSWNLVLHHNWHILSHTTSQQNKMFHHAVLLLLTLTPLLACILYFFTMSSRSWEKRT